jgi:hypothetical protein
MSIFRTSATTSGDSIDRLYLIVRELTDDSTNINIKETQK